MELGRVIPVSARASKDAFRVAQTRLQNNEIIGIFPEGGISATGKMEKFYSGFEIVARGIDGVIVPFYIHGMEGSLFSRTSKHRNWSRRRVHIIYGAPIPMDSDAKTVYDVISNLKEAHGSK